VEAGSIEGTSDPWFAAVREQFAVNFAERGELGAAVCVTVRGRVVVDLRGGWADPDRGRPWEPDTLVNVFSVGKGMLAACMARLTGQGQLDPDAPVVRYWPEFAAAGKDAVIVRQLLSHQAGIPALHAALPPGSALDWTLMTSALAAEEPWWQPGHGHGYHVNTFGFLGGELIRRLTGLMPGEYLQRQLAGPLGADVRIGLAPSEQRRVADFAWPGPSSTGGDAAAATSAAATGTAASGAAETAAATVTDSGDAASTSRNLAGQRAGDEGWDRADLVSGGVMTMNAYLNPPDFSGAGVVNTAAWRGAQLPSANAHATAAGIARIYAALAAGGAIDGVRVVDAGALAAAVQEQVYGDDLVLRRPSRFGLGFQLTHPERRFGSGERCFGHFGAGGSVGFCDPDAGLAFGYVTNQMGPRWRNPRNTALMDACYASL